MLFRPRPADVQIILFYLGKVIRGLGFMMLLPGLVAIPLGEWNALTAFVIGAGVSLIVGSATEAWTFTRATLEWSHAMVTVALAWLLGPVFAAIPLYLSGHYADLLDAVFDAMSGLTTSGLAVIQDLDHLPLTMNLYRHLTHFAGGQGIVVVVLSLFAAGAGRVGALYVSEARDERIMPNIIRTARFIYIVAAVYLLIGTTALFVAVLNAGIDPGRALWHALNLFFAAFDTGGFSPQSTSIAYYHSMGVEAVVVVLMFAGTLSFGLHFQLWRADRRELFRNLETRSLGLTMLATTALILFGLARSGALTQPTGLIRKGVFTLVSAHTGTGFAVTAPRLTVTDWGTLAPAAVVTAMALGGMASSTAGGIKAFRVGIATKGLLADIKKVLLPESALVVTTYHSQRRRRVTPDLVRSATSVLLLYLITYLVGGIVALIYGRWGFEETFFESVSAAANVGLSVGITSPDMPILLQVTYIVQMWLGRLEFMAGFALFGYLVSSLRGRT